MFSFVKIVGSNLAFTEIKEGSSVPTIAILSIDTDRNSHDHRIHIFGN